MSIPVFSASEKSAAGGERHCDNFRPELLLRRRERAGSVAEAPTIWGMAAAAACWAERLRARVSASLPPPAECLGAWHPLPQAPRARFGFMSVTLHLHTHPRTRAHTFTRWGPVLAFVLFFVYLFAINVEGGQR